MTNRVLAYGTQGWLVEPADPDDVLGLTAAARGLSGVDEVVPAARTLLVLAAPDPDLARRLRRLAPHPAGTMGRAGEVTLDVVYDGADLAVTAAEVGLDPDGVVRVHTGGSYVVAFCGFAPGFAYLTGLDPALHVARRADPRTRVPAGSVAIAGEFAGVYPRASPGGWRLLGHTEASLWDARADPPSPLVPGTRVRFRAR